MKKIIYICFLSVFTLYSGIASEHRNSSPDKRFIAIATEDRITITDSHGRVLLSEDYRDRDRRPESGRWTRSSRFYVYPLLSQGGHSPWHRPFVIADTLTRRTYTDVDLGEGAAVTDFQLSGKDTISYHILDRSKDNWDAGVPGLPRRFSLADKIATLKPTK